MEVDITEIIVIGALLTFVGSLIIGVARSFSINRDVMTALKESLEQNKEMYREITQSRQTRDTVERAYLQESLPVTKFIDVLKAVVSAVNTLNIPVVDDYADLTEKFLDAVTDGVENTDVVSEEPVIEPEPEPAG